MNNLYFGNNNNYNNNNNNNNNNYKTTFLDILSYQMFFEIPFKGTHRLIASYMIWDKVPYLKEYTD